MTTREITKSSEVADGHREHEEQALDELEVAGGAADDLAGGQLVLAAAVEPGDRAEHLGAQVVLHVEGEPAAVVAADVGERRRRRRRRRRGRPPRGPWSGSWSPMTSSMITLVTSGTSAMTAMPPSEEPEGEERRPWGTARRTRPVAVPIPVAAATPVPPACLRRPDLPEGTNAGEADFIPPQQSFPHRPWQAHARGVRRGGPRGTPAVAAVPGTGRGGRP